VRDIGHKILADPLQFLQSGDIMKNGDGPRTPSVPFPFSSWEGIIRTTLTSKVFPKGKGRFSSNEGVILFLDDVPNCLL